MIDILIILCIILFIFGGFLLYRQHDLINNLITKQIMQVNIQIFKDTSKWYEDINYISNLQTYQTNEIINEAKKLYPILNSYNFTIEVSDFISWNKILVLK